MNEKKRKKHESFKYNLKVFRIDFKVLLRENLLSDASLSSSKFKMNKIISDFSFLTGAMSILQRKLLPSFLYKSTTT